MKNESAAHRRDKRKFEYAAPEMSIALLLPRRYERLHHNRIWLHADGNQRHQGIFGRLQFARLAFLNHSHIARLRIEHQQVILVWRERERIGMTAYGQTGQTSSDVDVVHGDTVRPEIRHVEPRIIDRDRPVRWMLPDLQAAANFIRVGLDNRNTVGAEIAYEHLAAIGLQRETDWRAANVEQREHPVVFFCNTALRRLAFRISTCAFNLFFLGLQLNRRYLRRSGA